MRQQRIFHKQQMSGSVTTSKQQKAAAKRQGASGKWIKSIKGKVNTGKGVLSCGNVPDALLPQAAREIHFEILNSPAEPVFESSLIESLKDFNENDVILGSERKGDYNKCFRSLIGDFQQLYSSLNKRKEKRSLFRSIVLIIRLRGGRFFKPKDITSKDWIEVGDERAIRKVGFAFLDVTKHWR